MPQHTVYGLGGFNASKPNANAVEQWDDDTRTYTDYRTNPATTRAYTAEENAAADARTGVEQRAAAEETLLDQLAAGIAQIITARAAATDDINVASTLRTDALNVKAAAATQKTQVDAFAPGATYKQADLTAIKSALSQILARQALIIDTIASLAAWRKAVDENAVITDNALLWLAKHATGEVLDA